MTIEELIKSIIVQFPAIGILLIFVYTVYNDWKREREYYRSLVDSLIAENIKQSQAVRDCLEHIPPTTPLKE